MFKKLASIIFIFYFSFVPWGSMILISLVFLSIKHFCKILANLILMLVNIFGWRVSKIKQTNKQESSSDIPTMIKQPMLNTKRIFSIPICDSIQVTLLEQHCNQFSLYVCESLSLDIKGYNPGAILGISQWVGVFPVRSRLDTLFWQFFSVYTQKKVQRPNQGLYMLNYVQNFA